jgi:hypothetical protein
MVFYDATDKQGICQEIDRLCDTTDTSYTRQAKTARANQALETIVSKIITADGTWQFNDNNYTTNPVGVADLSTGVHEYTFSNALLQIEEVDILDLDGRFRAIKPVDSLDLGGSSFEEYFNITYNGTSYTAQSGFPEYYDKLERSVKFDKAPTATYCTLTSGLRVRFKKTASLFSASPATPTTADGTEPGFASPYHILVAYMASIPYCMTYKKDRVALYEKRVDELTKDLIKFYSQREQDVQKIMTMEYVDFR